MKDLILTSIISIIFLQYSYSQILKDTVLDFDGNVYHTVKIDTQIWFVENLKTTKYKDGTEIPNIKDSLIWSSLESGAYCNYYNNEENLNSCGRLYNWFAVNESKGVCPEGWHVPINEEWNIFIKNIDSFNDANNNKGWWSYQLNGQNYLPIDYRDNNGNFLNDNSLMQTNYGGWWTSTEISEQYAWLAYIGFSSYSMLINKYFKNAGYSVLCIKD